MHFLVLSCLVLWLHVRYHGRQAKTCGTQVEHVTYFTFYSNTLIENVFFFSCWNLIFSKQTVLKTIPLLRLISQLVKTPSGCVLLCVSMYL